MKWSSFLAVAMLAGLAGCSPFGAPATPAVEQHFEAITVAGSYRVPDDILKINTATGDAWIHCCGTNNNNFSHIKDAQALPAGDYHLLQWSQIGLNGDVSYNVYRFDKATGHTWVYKPTDNNTDYWIDLNGTITVQ